MANGFISGIDQVPPGLLRAGRILGAPGLVLERHVVIPAALPGVLGGLRQGWTVTWHALMAGEFLIPGEPAADWSTLPAADGLIENRRVATERSAR